MENNTDAEPTHMDFGSSAVLAFPELAPRTCLTDIKQPLGVRLQVFPEVFPVGGDEVLSGASLPWALGVVIGLTCVLGGPVCFPIRIGWVPGVCSCLLSCWLFSGASRGVRGRYGWSAYSLRWASVHVEREVGDLETSACFTGRSVTHCQCPLPRKADCAPFPRHEVAETVLSKPFRTRMWFINALAVLLLNLGGTLPFSFIKMTVTFAVWLDVHTGSSVHSPILRFETDVRNDGSKSSASS